MNVIKYKYYITYTYISNTNTVEVHPIGVDGLSINYRGNDGQIFKRRELSGKLTFIDQPKQGWSDYTLFRNIDASIYDKCTEIKIEIKRSCDNGVTYQDNFWNGYFSTTDGTFDLDKCTFSVECRPDDEYRCFIENNEAEYNPSAILYKTGVKANIPIEYEFYTCQNTLGNCNDSLPAPSATWLIFHQDTCNGLPYYIYYREVTVIPCQDNVAITPGSGWEQDTSYSPLGDCLAGLSKWVRTPQTVVTNNPNPDVASGNFVNGIDTPPPKTQTLTVTKQSTPQTPIIVGKDVVSVLGFGGGFPVATTEYYYVKYPRPNATYLWSISGGTNSIISGGATSAVTVSIIANGTVSVVETTSCGASSTIDQVFTATALGGDSTYNSEVEIIGNLELCVGEVAEYFLNGETGRIATLTNYTVASIVATQGQGTHGNFTITALEEGTTQVLWSGGGARDSSTTPGITITVKNKKAIAPIYGDAAVCNNSQAYYSIPDTDLGGFTWEVIGGAITSGQGTNEILVTWNGVDGSGIVSVAQDFNCGCNWIMIAGYEGGNTCSWWWCPTDSYEFINTTSFQDVVNYLITQICSGSNIKSDFFEWNPPADTVGYVAGFNYVTGLPNQLTYITLQPLRSVLYAMVTANQFDYVQPKLDEVLTWDDIEKIFREVFNAYWFIENGVVRVEHISWFNRTVAYDLTDSFYHKYSVGKNIYSYDKIKAPKFERFKWKSALYADFIGAEISYSGTCVTNESSQMVSNRDVSFIITDLQQLTLNPNSFSTEGFVLMCCDSNYSLQHEEGKITGILKPNGHLSWANLHWNYHRYDRVLLNGMMNLIDTIFITARRFKTQEQVSIPFCCDETINPLTDLITTKVGNGIIDEAQHDLKTDELKIKLLHDL
jgi:hypothetical protein